MYGTVQYSLDINYTLSVLPENELYDYSVSVTALAGPCESNSGTRSAGRSSGCHLVRFALRPDISDEFCFELPQS